MDRPARGSNLRLQQSLRTFVALPSWRSIHPTRPHHALRKWRPSSWLRQASVPGRLRSPRLQAAERSRAQIFRSQPRLRASILPTSATKSARSGGRRRSAIPPLSGGKPTSGERTDIEARDPTRPSSSPAAAPSRLVPGRPHPDLALFVSRQDHRHGLGMDRLPNATALEELVSCCRKISLLDITQGRPCGTISIWRHVRDDAQSQMGPVGRVSDRSGKIIMFGREISRSAVRYKAAGALFQLLLTSRLCDLEKLKRRQRR